MGWDAVDLWLRGRKMTPYSVKMFRSLVFVTVLAALGEQLPRAHHGARCWCWRRR